MNQQDIQLKDIVLGRHGSVRDGISMLHRCGVRNVLVVDADGQLVGIATEDNIRAGLANGVDLETPITEVMCPPRTVASPAESRADVLDRMHAAQQGEIPVVDDQRRVVGVHLFDRTVARVPRQNWAVIMAGGRGSRLTPLTDSIPKPMLRIAGRPILERIILHLVGAGITRIFVAVNYLADAIIGHFGDGSRFGCSIEYLRENTSCPLGTGGPLGLLWRQGYRPSAPVLVMNGDLVTGFAVADLVDAHYGRGDLVTVAVSEHRYQVPFGVLEGTDRLTRIVEKPSASWMVNSGIYVIEPRLLERIPPDENYPITQLLEDCVKRNEPIGIWHLKDHWQDIGTPSQLANARSGTS